MRLKHIIHYLRADRKIRFLKEKLRDCVFYSPLFLYSLMSDGYKLKYAFIRLAVSSGERSELSILI